LNEKVGRLGQSNTKKMIFQSRIVQSKKKMSIQYSFIFDQDEAFGFFFPQIFMSNMFLFMKGK